MNNFSPDAGKTSHHPYARMRFLLPLPNAYFSDGEDEDPW